MNHVKYSAPGVLGLLPLSPTLLLSLCTDLALPASGPLHLLVLRLASSLSFIRSQLSLP